MAFTYFTCSGKINFMTQFSFPLTINKSARLTNKLTCKKQAQIHGYL